MRPTASATALKMARWFNDEAADDYDSNVHGSTDCLVEI